MRDAPLTKVSSLLMTNASHSATRSSLRSCPTSGRSVSESAVVAKDTIPGCSRSTSGRPPSWSRARRTPPRRRSTRRTEVAAEAFEAGLAPALVGSQDQPLVGQPEESPARARRSDRSGSPERRPRRGPGCRPPRCAVAPDARSAASWRPRRRRAPLRNPSRHPRRTEGLQGLQAPAQRIGTHRRAVPTDDAAYAAHAVSVGGTARTSGGEAGGRGARAERRRPGVGRRARSRAARPHGCQAPGARYRPGFFASMGITLRPHARPAGKQRPRHYADVRWRGRRSRPRAE